MSRCNQKTFRMSLAVLTLAAIGAAPAWAQDALGLPRSLSQEPKTEPAKPTQEQAQPKPQGQETSGSEFLDLHRAELGVHVGVLAFASDYESSAQFGGGVLLRAPMPWFSRDVCGMEKDNFGLFLDLTVASIKRDIDILEKKSGTLLFVALGMDCNFYEDETFRFQAQLAIQYGYFGGVTDLHNGFAPLIGLAGRINVDKGIGITFNPQFGLGDSGDFVFFLNVGAQIDF